MNTKIKHLISIFLILLLFAFGSACSVKTTATSNAQVTSQSTASIAPSTIYRSEVSRIMRSFEQDIAWSDASVIGRFISKTRDPDQTMDYVFEVDNVLYGDIAEHTIHIHQIQNQDNQIELNTAKILVLNKVDLVFYRHVRYYPMEQFDIRLDEKGEISYANIENNWPAEAFTTVDQFSNTVKKIKREQNPIDPTTKSQIRYSRDSEPTILWNAADSIAIIETKEVIIKSFYALEAKCIVKQTLKGPVLPTEIFVHMLPDTEIGKSYLVLLIETTPGRPGTTYYILSLSGQLLADSQQAKQYLNYTNE